MLKEILKTEKVTVVVYILKAKFADSLDFGSQNDSYFVVEIGDISIRSESQIDNNNNPNYYETVRFEHSFPGASDLKIKFYDSDYIKSDDMIGIASIDLERRFFDPKWRQLEHVPIETLDIV